MLFFDVSIAARRRHLVDTVRAVALRVAMHKTRLVLKSVQPSRGSPAAHVVARAYMPPASKPGPPTGQTR